MGSRRAVVGLTLLLAVVTPSCKFSRSSNHASATSTSAETVPLFAEDTSTSEDTSSTVVDSSSTTRKTATTVKALSTPRTTARPVATTARPTTTVPHCDASMPNPSPRGSRQTLSVSSTAPNAAVSASLTFYDASGAQTSNSSFSGYTTDGTGFWSHTVSIPANSQTTKGTASVTVGSLHCSTTFAVS